MKKLSMTLESGVSLRNSVRRTIRVVKVLIFLFPCGRRNDQGPFLTRRLQSSVAIEDRGALNSSTKASPPLAGQCEAAHGGRRPCSQECSSHSAPWYAAGEDG